MDISPQKIVGWLAVASGLLVIFISIYYSFLFFTGKAGFPQVFKQPQAVAVQPAVTPAQESAPLPETPDNQNLPESFDPAAANVDMQALTQQAMSQTVSNLIPPDAIAKMLNIAAWSLFSFFLLSAGSNIAAIGIKLLGAKTQQ